MHLTKAKCFGWALMIAGIPLFGTRVSPNFGAATEIMLATFKEGRVEETKKVFWGDLPFSQKLKLLALWKVNLLICGGIGQFCRSRLEAMGIKVISEEVGEAEEVLQKWAKMVSNPNSKYKTEKGKHFTYKDYHS